MYLAFLRIEIRIGGGPRAKRRTVRTILEKVHRHFNVSVAEVERSGHPSESVIGIASLAESRREAREVLDRVSDAVQAHPRAEVLSIEWNEV
ncbi:DUF503 domain-containing protein [Tundrisphaera lichenicola]|uniref:DUF503 domain-containing protein n=1 Tax=Tundrisphaera lichenicola TaxID=2029860 RepID=UPI003EC03A41